MMGEKVKEKIKNNDTSTFFFHPFLLLPSFFHPSLLPHERGPTTLGRDLIRSMIETRRDEKQRSVSCSSTPTRLRLRLQLQLLPAASTHLHASQVRPDNCNRSPSIGPAESMKIRSPIIFFLSLDTQAPKAHMQGGGSACTAGWDLPFLLHAACCTHGAIWHMRLQAAWGWGLPAHAALGIFWGGPCGGA